MRTLRAFVSIFFYRRRGAVDWIVSIIFAAIAFYLAYGIFHPGIWPKFF